MSVHSARMCLLQIQLLFQERTLLQPGEIRMKCLIWRGKFCLPDHSFGWTIHSPGMREVCVRVRVCVCLLSVVKLKRLGICEAMSCAVLWRCYFLGFCGKSFHQIRYVERESNRSMSHRIYFFSRKRKIWRCTTQLVCNRTVSGPAVDLCPDTHCEKLLWPNILSVSSSQQAQLWLKKRRCKKLRRWLTI